MERIVRQTVICELSTFCDNGEKTPNKMGAGEENATGKHCLGHHCDFLRWITAEVIEHPQ